MTDLIACIIDGGSFGQVKALVEKEPWDKVYLICDKASRKGFPSSNFHFVEINPAMPLVELVEDIRKSLSRKLLCTEYALNIIYGPGKVHMAILSALLKMGCGIRLIAYTKEGVKEV